MEIGWSEKRLGQSRRCQEVARQKFSTAAIRCEAGFNWPCCRNDKRKRRAKTTRPYSLTRKLAARDLSSRALRASGREETQPVLLSVVRSAKCEIRRETLIPSREIRVGQWRNRMYRGSSVCKLHAKNDTSFIWVLERCELELKTNSQKRRFLCRPLTFLRTRI